MRSQLGFGVEGGGEGGQGSAVHHIPMHHCIQHAWLEHPAELAKVVVHHGERPRQLLLLFPGAVVEDGPVPHWMATQNMRKGQRRQTILFSSIPSAPKRIAGHMPENAPGTLKKHDTKNASKRK